MARGLGLLDAFDGVETELTLTELAARTGLSKPTVHRLLGQLVAWGGVERVRSGYRLGARLFQLGLQTPRHRALRETALPYLEELYEVTRENVHLTVLSGHSVLCVEKVCGHRTMQIRPGIGSRLPAHSTASGKLLLALLSPERVQQIIAGGLERLTPRTIVAPRLLWEELARTRARGYGLNREESQVGIAAVSAPVFDGSGTALAAMSVAGSVHRVDAHRLVPQLLEAARAVSETLARLV